MLFFIEIAANSHIIFYSFSFPKKASTGANCYNGIYNGHHGWPIGSVRYSFSSVMSFRYSLEPAVSALCRIAPVTSVRYLLAPADPVRYRIATVVPGRYCIVLVLPVQMYIQYCIPEALNRLFKCVFMSIQ